MPFTFNVDTVARIVSVTLTPPAPDAEGFTALLRAVVTHPEFRPGFGILYDRRAVPEPPSTQYAHHKAASLWGFAGMLGRPRVAVLVPDLVGYGMARMTGLLVDGVGTDFRPFYEEGDARAWLGAGASTSGTRHATAVAM